MAEDSLPASTDSETHCNPAEKVMQIGEDAGSKILEGFLNRGNSATNTRTATLIVDLTTHTADVARAFVNRVGSASSLLNCMHATQ